MKTNLIYVDTDSFFLIKAIVTLTFITSLYVGTVSMDTGIANQTLESIKINQPTPLATTYIYLVQISL